MIRYQPENWNDSQRELHQADNLDTAMHHASCLTGWYCRPVRIDMQTVGDAERYTMRPADIDTPKYWQPVYIIESCF